MYTACVASGSKSSTTSPSPRCRRGDRPSSRRSSETARRSRHTRKTREQCHDPCPLGIVGDTGEGPMETLHDRRSACRYARTTTIAAAPLLGHRLSKQRLAGFPKCWVVDEALTEIRLRSDAFSASGRTERRPARAHVTRRHAGGCLVASVLSARGCLSTDAPTSPLDSSGSVLTSSPAMTYAPVRARNRACSREQSIARVAALSAATPSPKSVPAAPFLVEETSSKVLRNPIDRTVQRSRTSRKGRQVAAPL